MNISNSNPLVSIVITTYNHAKYISSAINSALSQTYKNLQILVIDDGSTDNTKEIVTKFKDVEYYYQNNQGLPAARNYGIAKAKGEFISFLDADDFLYPEGIEINISYLVKDINIAFVSGAYINVDEFGNETEESSIRIDGNNFHHLLVDNYIGNPGIVLYRKNIIEKYLFNTSLKCIEDYDIYLRISKDYKIINHEKFIAAYRRLSNSMSSNTPLMLDTIIKVRKNIIKDLKHDIRLNTLCNIGIKNATEYFVNVAKIQIFDSNIGSKMKLDRWFKTILLIIKHRPLLIVKVLGKKLIFKLSSSIGRFFLYNISNKDNFETKEHKIFFLVYSKIHSPVINIFDSNVSDINFKSQIKYLKELDCIINTDQLLEFLSGTKNLDKDYVYLTFNYGYLNSLITAAPLLESFELPGTFVVNKNLLNENYQTYWWDVLEAIFLININLPEELNLLINGKYLKFDFHNENISEFIDIETYLWNISLPPVNKRTRAFKIIFELLLKANTLTRNIVIEQLIIWSNFDLNNFEYNKLASYKQLEGYNVNRYLDIRIFESTLNFIPDNSENKSENSEVNFDSFKIIKGETFCENVFNSFNNDDCSLLLNKTFIFENANKNHFKIVRLNVTNESKNELHNALIKFGYKI